MLPGIGLRSRILVLTMPFVLFGVHRYFERRRPLSLVGASAAFVAQNLSCGYYLVYFSPFVVAYVLFEIGRRRLWRDRGLWIALSVAALGVTATTLPFLLPYLELRRLGQPARSLDEVDGLIYHERCPSGYRIIVPTISHSESNIDLELLFNAIVNKSIKTR